MNTSTRQPLALVAMFGASILTVLGTLPVFLLGAQFVLVRRDIDLNEADLGLAVTAFFGSAALATGLMGTFADHASPRLGAVMGGVLATVANLVIALAAHDRTAIALGLALAGCANAALQSASNATLTGLIPPDRQGLGFAVKQAAIPIAILVGGLFVPLVGSQLGWRWSFILVAVVGSAVALRGLRLDGGPAPETAAGTFDRPRVPWTGLLLTAAAVMIAAAAVSSAGTFLSTWAFRSGLSPDEAGLLMAAGSALSIVGRLATGAVADRIPRGHLLGVAGQMIGGAVGIMLLLVGSVPTLLLGTALFFVIGWSWPGLAMYAAVRAGRTRPGPNAAAVQFGSFAGGAFGPLLFGAVVVGWDFETAWLGTAFALCLSAGLALLARAAFVRARVPA